MGSAELVGWIQYAPVPAVHSRLGVFRMNVVALIVSFVLFLGGLLLMGYAPEFTGWQGITFIAGILCMALSFALPVHVLTKLD
jgi:hypothetical protein